MTKKIKGNRIAMYLFLALCGIVFAFPFYFMLVSATNASVDVTKGHLLPGKEFFNNLHRLLENSNLLNALKNSAIISISQTCISIFLASLAGYAFEIHKSKGKEVLFKFLLLSMMIPFATLMIPLFKMFGAISDIFPSIGIDTLASAIMPYLSTTFLIFFFRQNTKLFPKSLLEAGRIDGLSEIMLFIKIYMPTMKTTYAAAAIITFMNSWNNYLWPLVVLQSPENHTVPLIISNLGSSYTPDYGIIMVGIVIATLPTAAIFFFLQKHFVAGMTGSVK